MHTDKYLSQEISHIDDITLSFQDDLEKAYEDIIYNEDSEIHNRYNSFLEYYKQKTKTNDTSNKDFPMFQSQKLAEIVSLHPDYSKAYKTITRPNCYKFLYNKMSEKLPNNNFLLPYSKLLTIDAVKKWFSLSQTPSKRIELYKISFALDLPIKNSENNFSHTALFNKVFHVRNVIKTPDELCLLYAKQNHLSYVKAIELYQEYLKRAKIEACSVFYTKKLGTKTIINNLITTTLDENSFLELLLSYSPHLYTVNDNLHKKITEYIDTISNKSYLDIVMKSRDNILQDIAIKNRYNNDNSKNNSEYINLKNFLLFGGYYNVLPIDEDIEYLKKDKEGIDIRSIDHTDRTDYVFLPKAYHKYNEIKKQKVITSSYYEELRRILIYYHFFIYWCPLNDDYFPNCDDYIEEINQLLNLYMLPPLYAFNMFDFFYIYCSRSYDPISTYIVLSKLAMQKNEEINIDKKIIKRENRDKNKKL